MIGQRKSIRLRAYDYARRGAYFVTVCVENRECLLGEVRDEEMHLSDTGTAVQTAWADLGQRFPGALFDAFGIMPNHIHGIVVLDAVPTEGIRLDVGAGLALPSAQSGEEGRASPAPTSRQQFLPQAVKAPSLGDVMRVFKSTAAIAANRTLGRSGRPFWQRNYFEHIVRHGDELTRIRQYIADNPAQWALDLENPDRRKDVQPFTWEIR